MDTFIADEITRKVKSLPDNLQRQVLIFVGALEVSSLRGRSGTQLVQFAHTIASEDLSLMQQAIETDCEQVEADDW